MKKFTACAVAGTILMGILALGCQNKPIAEKQTGQKPAGEQAPAKKAPQGR